MPARRQDREHHVIADADALHLVAESFHNSRCLMSQDRWEWHKPALSIDRIEIAPAQSARRNADEHLTSPWRFELNLLDLERSPRTGENGPTHPHVPPVAGHAAHYKQNLTLSPVGSRLSTTLSEENAWGLGVVARRSTTDQVLHELRTAILTGRIPTEEPLPETVLAKAFGTGRSAIREALRHLAQEGLVITEINRGARVRSIEVEDVIDVYRARSAIEAAAAEVVVARPDELDLTAVREAQRRIADASPPDVSEAPSPELIAADIDFHRAMVALAGSPRLSKAHEPLAAESQMLLNLHPVYRLSDYVADHQQLLDAIEARDPSTPELVRRHLELSERLIVEEATQRHAHRDNSGSPRHRTREETEV
jgi:DNA-binding GntR family transcriptional regulator